MDVVERCIWIDRFDTRFGRRLLLALLRTASRREDVYGRRAAAVLANVPEVGGHLDFTKDRYFPPVLGFRERLSARIEMTSFPGSIMDWVWEGGPIMVAAWVQADHDRPCERHALERCAKSLKRESKPVHALLLLSRTPLPAEALPHAGYEAFIGSILWSEAESDLRAIRPEGELAFEDWNAILDDMCSPVGAS